jgi:hypothetical protein
MATETADKAKEGIEGMKEKVAGTDGIGKHHHHTVDEL